MSKLTRTLALLASIAVVSTAFVACGGNTESTNAGGDTNSAAPAAENNGGEAGGEAGGESGGEASGDITLPDSDNTLTIVCWTDGDLNNMFDLYDDYKVNPDVNVVYTQVGSSGGTAAVEYNSYLNSGSDVDLFVAEAGWILNYINNADFAAPLSSLGITEADYGDAYQYTVEIGKDNDGVLKAASWQAAAGGWAYNADLAEQYLGVTDTDAMQAKVADWDSFKATAEELKTASDGSVYITASLGGLWQAFSTAKNAAWVSGTTIQTDVAKEFTTMAKEYVDNGYVDPTVKQWENAWQNYGKEGKALGYFYSTWCLGEAAQLEQNCGTDGNWRIIVGPQEYFWGGSWFCVSPNCNTATEAANFVRTFTCNADSMEAYALYSGDFTNNKVAMNKIISDGSNSNPLLGGQDQFAVLAGVADGIKMSDSITKYDQNLKDTFLDTLINNISSDEDTIISTFVGQALADNPDLSDS